MKMNFSRFLLTHRQSLFSVYDEYIKVKEVCSSVSFFSPCWVSFWFWFEFWICFRYGFGFGLRLGLGLEFGLGLGLVLALGSRLTVRVMSR